MSDFDPDDVADISARLERAEMEETAIVVTMIELPYTEAKHLIALADGYENGEWQSMGELLSFTLQLVDNVRTAVNSLGE